MKVATIEVDPEKLTESAVTIAPEDALIASTKGIETKLVPVIVTAVDVFSTTEGEILDIVGKLTTLVKLAPDTAGKTDGNLASGIVPAVNLSADTSVIPLLSILLFAIIISDYPSLLYYI